MAVAHKEYRALTGSELHALFKQQNEKKLVYDVKAIIDRDSIPEDMVIKRL